MPSHRGTLDRWQKYCENYQVKNARFGPLCKSCRKYIDYVYGRCSYRSAWKNKEYLRRQIKPKNDMMYQDIYNCICQNTKNWIHYVKPTVQLLFKNRFPKATGPDLLMKSTWTSLFSADISIIWPAYHFLTYSPRTYWPEFGNTMSGADSTIYIVYSNPEHMSVFMSCDILPNNSVPPALGTNTWYDVVPDMVFTLWKT